MLKWLKYKNYHVKIAILTLFVSYQVTGQGTNSTTGQLLSQGNGTYLIQQSVVDGDPTHALISAAAARTSPQTETAVNCCMSYDFLRLLFCLLDVG